MIKQFTSDDYEMICEWWNAHKFPPVPLNFLPKYGAIVYVGDTPVAAAWVYKTDSDLGWIEWYVSNPEFKDRNARGDCLDDLIVHLMQHAKSIDIKALFTSIKVPRLIKRLGDLGFQEADINMTNMIGII